MHSFFPYLSTCQAYRNLFKFAALTTKFHVINIRNFILFTLFFFVRYIARHIIFKLAYL